jgi:hypothetical protein
MNKLGEDTPKKYNTKIPSTNAQFVLDLWYNVIRNILKEKYGYY